MAFGWIMSVTGLGATTATVFRYLETHDWHIWNPLPFIVMTVLTVFAWITGHPLSQTRYMIASPVSILCEWHLLRPEELLWGQETVDGSESC